MTNEANPGPCLRCKRPKDPQLSDYGRCPLHAAAPELLAALERMVDAVEGEPTQAYINQVTREARAAIARAKGGES